MSYILEQDGLFKTKIVENRNTLYIVDAQEPNHIPLIEKLKKPKDWDDFYNFLIADPNTAFANFVGAWTPDPTEVETPKEVTITNLPAQLTSQVVTGVSTVSQSLTITLPAAAGQFHKITSLEITMYSTAARTGNATPVTVTTTNLNNMAFTFPSQGAIGQVSSQQINRYNIPLKSTLANTPTTIVCPIATNVIWRVNCVYSV